MQPRTWLAVGHAPMHFFVLRKMCPRKRISVFLAAKFDTSHHLTEKTAVIKIKIRKKRLTGGVKILLLLDKK